MTMACGALGFVTGVMKSFSYLGQAAPEDRWIWTLGVGESLHNVALALGLVTLAAIAASVGAYRFSQASPRTTA
jgi:hypothetical protein